MLALRVLFAIVAIPVIIAILIPQIVVVWVLGGIEGVKFTYLGGWD